MRRKFMLFAVACLAVLCDTAVAQDKPVVAMIGTGTLGGTLGPALGKVGYSVIYGSRDPDREEVRTLVTRTGQGAAAASQRDAAQRAQIIVLAVPREVLDEVVGNLGDIDGKVLVDVSAGYKRVAEDGYLELASDSANSERIQARNPAVRVVRLNLPFIVFFVEPRLLGTPPTVLIAGDDPRAREAVANMMFLDPADLGDADRAAALSRPRRSAAHTHSDAVR